MMHYSNPEKAKMIVSYMMEKKKMAERELSRLRIELAKEKAGKECTEREQKRNGFEEWGRTGLYDSAIFNLQERIKHCEEVVEQWEEVYQYALETFLNKLE
jgi:hypothetical protein